MIAIDSRPLPITNNLKERTAARLDEIAAAAQRPPQPAAAPAQPVPQSPRELARQLSYRSGIKSLENFFEQVFTLQDASARQAVELAELRMQIQLLQQRIEKLSAPAHMVGVEKRDAKTV